MACRRLVTGGRILSRRLLSERSATVPVAGDLWRRSSVTSSSLYQRNVFRLLSKGKGFGDDADDETISPGDQTPFGEDLDPFGVDFEDGAEMLGPEENKPPLYRRDVATGRFTGEIEQELTEEEKRMLKADSLEQDKMLLKRLDKHWEQSGLDESGQVAELNDLGDRIRHSDMGLNVLGRSVKAQASTEKLDDGSELRDESGFSQHLTPSEFETFSAFMEKKHGVAVDKDDIPVQEKDPSSSDTASDELKDDPDNVELSLKWLTARAQRQMDDKLDDDPYSDLMPGDLSPTRLVNRKRAKPLPVKVLHHNNIALLHRYMTPTGQIMNRVQSRLGARDQRRISKLIKRARSLGLVPYVGQFKSEDHGWIHEEDIGQDREWEEELVRRGLVIKGSKSGDDE